MDSTTPKSFETNAIKQATQVQPIKSTRPTEAITPTKNEIHTSTDFNKPKRTNHDYHEKSLGQTDTEPAVSRSLSATLKPGTHYTHVT
jgi:hypothetical protein